MQTDYILNWFLNGRVHAAACSTLPLSLEFQGKTYRMENLSLGDVDYLRNAQQELIGFSFIVGEPNEQEEAFHKSLLRQCQNVELDNGLLTILIKREPYRIQTIQAIGSVLYRASDDSLMIAVPDWGVEKVGFSFDREMPK